MTTHLIIGICATDFHLATYPHVIGLHPDNIVIAELMTDEYWNSIPFTDEICVTASAPVDGNKLKAFPRARSVWCMERPGLADAILYAAIENMGGNPYKALTDYADIIHGTPAMADLTCARGWPSIYMAKTIYGGLSALASDGNFAYAFADNKVIFRDYRPKPEYRPKMFLSSKNYCNHFEISTLRNDVTPMELFKTVEFEGAELDDIPF